MEKLNKNSSGTMDDSFYIRVIELALKYPQGFTYSDITENKELSLKDWEKNILNRHFQHALNRYNYGQNTVGETMFSFVHGDTQNHQSNESNYIVNMDTQFNYLDYQELKFARSNAREAKRLSLVAISLSALAIIIPFIVAYYMTQTIKVDGGQFQEIKQLIPIPKGN